MSGGDGGGAPVGQTVGCDRTALSEGSAWVDARRIGADAAGLFLQQWHFGLKAHTGTANSCTRGRHGGERGRHHEDGGTVARRRKAGSCRRRLHRRGEAPGNRRIGSADRRLIVGKRGMIEVLREGAQKETSKAAEKPKATVRAFVEHPPSS